MLSIFFYFAYGLLARSTPENTPSGKNKWGWKSDTGLEDRYRGKELAKVVSKNGFKVSLRVMNYSRYHENLIQLIIISLKLLSE